MPLPGCGRVGRCAPCQGGVEYLAMIACIGRKVGPRVGPSTLAKTLGSHACKGETHDCVFDPVRGWLSSC